MALSAEQFGKAVVASGLITAEELRSLWAELPSAERPKDGESFSSVLLKRERLNDFQAKELLSGSNIPLVFGDYVLLSKIGAGGMGQVFKAHHRRMDRLAAIKILPSSLTKDEATVKRFEREVKAAAKLNHPNIVQTFDAGVQRGVHYLVMEHVDGHDLSAVVKERGPLPVPEAVDCILQAARGLAFAHSKGVVHRDIKPANLLLDNEGVVKILDMGLARFDSSGDAADHQLTNTGAVMGTVDYMSPEQATNTHNADARSDIYSLGCSLYRLLTGGNLYEGTTVVEKILAHMGQPIPALTQKRPECPAEIDRIFRKMVAKKPEDRYQQASELVAELEASRNPGATASFTSPGDGQLSNFLQSLNQPKGTATSTVQPSVQTVVKTEQTMAYAGLEVETDPKSEVLPSSVMSQAKQATSSKSKGSGKGGKKPPVKMIAAGAAGFLFLLLGVIVIVRNKDGKEVARLEVPDGNSVEMRPKTPTNTSTPTMTVPAGTLPPPVNPARESAASRRTSPPLQTLDLLALLDLQQDRVPAANLTGANNWTRSGDQITYTTDGKSGRIAVPVDLKNATDYEIVAKVRRLSGTSVFTFDLPCSDKSETGLDIVVGGGIQLKVENDRRQKIGDWPTAAKDGGTIIARVRREPSGEGSIRVTVDGLPAAEWQGAISKIGKPWDSHPGFPGTSTLEVFCFKDSFEFSSWQLQVFAGQALPLRQSITPSPAKVPFNAMQAKAHQAAWAKHLGTEVVKPNSIGMQMTLIPPGEFLMGEQLDSGLKFAQAAKISLKEVEISRIQEEGPQHRVTISQPFCLSATEVTVGQFGRFVDATKYWTQAEQFGAGNSHSWTASKNVKPETVQVTWRKPGYEITDNTPVTQVTWSDTIRFCNWLSVQENLNPCYEDDGNGNWKLVVGANGYRLPTEAEWEFACRAGTTTQYSFGDDPTQLPKYGWSSESGVKNPQPVAAKLPNAFGLFDMHGNVREWCYDWYSAEFYAASPQADPRGPDFGTDRVMRGGRWDSNSVNSRSTFRYDIAPFLRNTLGGFRILRAPMPPQTATDILLSPDHEWSLPEALGPLVNGQQVDANPFIATDGLTLLFASSRRQGQGSIDLWESRRESAVQPFGAAVNLPRIVNSFAADDQPCASADGLQLLFASNRPGVIGDYDLYISRRIDQTAPWGPPENLGPQINTTENESSPALSPDGLALYFTSTRANGHGSADIWCSRRPALDARFGEPVNLGPIVNSKEQEFDFQPASDGRSAVFCRGDRGDKNTLWLAVRPTHEGGFTSARQLNLFAEPDPTVRGPGLSLDGFALYFQSKRSGSIGDSDLWIVRRVPKIATADVRSIASGKITDINDPAFQAWIKDVQAMPVDKQIEAVSKKLVDLNPGFDGKVTDWHGKSTPKIENGVVTEIAFNTDRVADISPVRALVGLSKLNCSSSGYRKSVLSDLSPLRGMKLTAFECGGTRVSELSPLQGMPLTVFSCTATPLCDLSPLRGMQLQLMNIAASLVSDLSPLKGMPLKSLDCPDAPVSDLSSLSGMPLTRLICYTTKVSNLIPLQDCKSLTTLRIGNTKVTASSVAALQAKLPNCKIEWDDPAKPATPAPKPSGTK